MLIKLIVSLLLCELVHFRSLPVVEGDPTIQCAQTGAGKLRAEDLNESWNRKDGSYTIGSRLFFGRYNAALNSAVSYFENDFEDIFKAGAGQPEGQYCNYTLNPNTGWKIQLCDEKDESVKLRINAVQQTDPSSGKLITLEGWLHIEVELVDQEDTIRLMYLQLYDEYFNAIGEFVKNGTEQCPPSEPENYVSPTQYQFLPCSAIGAREAQGSQATFMVYKYDTHGPSLLNRARNEYFPSEEIYRKVHLTWRINEYWCSRHYLIIPMVFVLTSKNIDEWKNTTYYGSIRDPYFRFYEKLGSWKLYRKIPNNWLLPAWIGAADIKHPGRGALQCNNPIWDAPWIRGKFRHTVRQEYLHPSNRYDVYKNGSITIKGANTCQDNPFYNFNYAKFVGRCEAHQGKNTSSNYFHKCNTNASSPEFDGLNMTFAKYTNYVINFTTFRFQYCDNPCRAPETAEDALNISKFSTSASVTKPAIEIGPGLTHFRAKASIGRFWRGRKFHGVLCLIVTMFLMPVSNLLARYYKETFMRYQFKGIHVWYWAHVGAVLASMGILLSGLFGMAHTLRSWGRSRSSVAILHHSFGWISIFLQILMVIYGGFRSEKPKWNKVIMKGHSMVGLMINRLNITLIFLSTYIPASPSLRRCDRTGVPTGISVTFWMTMAWAGLDAIFHGFLTALQITADKTLEIKRPSYCPILPILDPNSHIDMRRSGLRKLLFYLYLFLSVVFTLGATLHLVVRYQPDGCVFGEMTCKAALGCTRVGLAMCKKLNIIVKEEEAVSLR